MKPTQKMLATSPLLGAKCRLSLCTTSKDNTDKMQFVSRAIGRVQNAIDCILHGYLWYFACAYRFLLFTCTIRVYEYPVGRSYSRACLLRELRSYCSITRAFLFVMITTCIEASRDVHLVGQVCQLSRPGRGWCTWGHECMGTALHKRGTLRDTCTLKTIMSWERTSLHTEFNPKRGAQPLGLSCASSAL